MECLSTFQLFRSIKERNVSGMLCTQVLNTSNVNGWVCALVYVRKQCTHTYYQHREIQIYTQICHVIYRFLLVTHNDSWFINYCYPQFPDRSHLYAVFESLTLGEIKISKYFYRQQTSQKHFKRAEPLNLRHLVKEYRAPMTLCWTLYCKAFCDRLVHAFRVKVK